jgi:hypothetical protein
MSKLVRALSSATVAAALLTAYRAAAAGVTGTESEIPIVGARPADDPGAYSFPEFDRREERLRQAMRSAAKREEILALLSTGQFGGDGQIVVRLDGDRGRLAFAPDDARSFERSLSSAEVGALRAFLAKEKAFELGPLTGRVYDGEQFELLRLTKTGGRRLFMNNPGLAGPKVYQRICDNFRALLGKPGLELHYAAEEENPDLKVLIADPRWAVVGVRLDGRQLLVDLSQRRSSWHEDIAFPLAHRIKADVPAGAAKEPTWVLWPGAVAVSAERLATLSIATIVPKGLRTDDWLNRMGWASQRDGARYFVGLRRPEDGGTYDFKAMRSTEGLYRVSSGGDPELIVAGKMSSPVLAADGHTVAVAKTDNRSWGHPQYLALIDTKTKEARRLDIASADQMAPIFATSDGVLVYRARANAAALLPDTKLNGPEKPEHFLVDPASGKAKKVEGDFDPIPRELRSPLQPAGADQIWAMKTDHWKPSSILGRYDLKRFVFTDVRALPGLAVGTNDIWVDEQTGQVYAVRDGDLLQFSLKADH